MKQHSLPDKVKIAFSKASDGSMAVGLGGKPTRLQQKNVEVFLKKHGFDPAERATVFVTYEPDNTYTHIERVHEGDKGPIRSDALFTTVKYKAITLTVADCIATIVYDPVAQMLGILHLGRHSSVAGLIEEFTIRVADEVGSDPRDWHVWMSPSLKSDHDRMEYFTPPHPDQWQAWQRTAEDGMIHIDIPGHNRVRFERLGVPQGNIFISTDNTYTDKRYFSHRASTELNQPERQGRMLVVAHMID